MVFEGADHFGGAGEKFEGLRVEGFDPAGIDHRGIDALRGEKVGRFFGHGNHVAQAEEKDAAAMAEDFALADLEQLRMLLGLRSGSRAAGVADGDGTGVVMGHGPEHVDEFLFVLGLHEDEIRDVAEVADVEESVMGGAVVAAQPGAVHAEGDVEILQGDVMDDHVISPLHKRAVDGQEGLVALGGEAAGEEGGVLFGDADVVVAVGVAFFEKTQSGASAHRGGDGDDAVVVVGKVGQLGPEELGVSGPAGRLGLPGLGLEFAQAVEFVRLLHGRRVALAFGREDVEKDGLVLGLEEFEGALEQGGVVAVDRPVVTETEVFEDNAGEEHVLHPGLDLVGEVEGDLAADGFDELGGLLVEVGVGGLGRDLAQVAGHRADILRDRPLVVVEHDDEAFGRLGHVVERLEADPAGESGVAGHHDDVFAGPAEVAGRSHTEAGGEGGASMAGAVAIVLAFGAEEEAV